MRWGRYVNPIALNALGWKYYLVYVCWLAFEAVFVFIFVIETKNRTLEETAALFDGAEQAEQIAQHAAEVAKASEDDEKAGSIEVVNAKSEDSI